MTDLNTQLARIKSDAQRGIGASSCDTLAMAERIEQAISLIERALQSPSKPPRMDISPLISNFSIPRYTLLYLLSLFAVDLVVHGITGSAPITIIAVIAAACVLHNPFARTSLLDEANTELAYERLQATNPHLTITRSTQA